MHQIPDEEPQVRFRLNAGRITRVKPFYPAVNRAIVFYLWHQNPSNVTMKAYKSGKHLTILKMLVDWMVIDRHFGEVKDL